MEEPKRSVNPFRIAATSVPARETELHPAASRAWANNNTSGTDRGYIGHVGAQQARNLAHEQDRA